MREKGGEGKKDKRAKRVTEGEWQRENGRLRREVKGNKGEGEFPCDWATCPVFIVFLFFFFFFFFLEGEFPFFLIIIGFL